MIATTRSLAETFADPYDPATSFQLSARLTHGGRFTMIAAIKEADDALQRREYKAFMRLIMPTLAFLTTEHRRDVLRRIVYNDLFLRSFEPKRFSVPLRETEGRFAWESTRSLHRELDVNIDTIKQTLCKESKAAFCSLYGFDLTTTLLSLRYSVQVRDGRAAGRTYNEVADSMFRETNPTFLHLDEKKGITTIVYLSDTTSHNGAFRYVEGSHLIKISPILKAFHEYTNNTLRVTTHEQVSQLPPEFRAGINYYYWLEPEKQRVIDCFTTTVTGPAGTAISFAGNRLLHGGGIPFFGERAALFLGNVGRVCHRARQVLHPVTRYQHGWGF